jgi:hypothetical protein
MFVNCLLVVHCFQNTRPFSWARLRMLAQFFAMRGKMVRIWILNVFSSTGNVVQIAQDRQKETEFRDPRSLASQLRGWLRKDIVPPLQPGSTKYPASAAHKIAYLII